MINEEIDLSNVLELITSGNQEDVSLGVDICRGQGWTNGMMMDQLRLNRLNPVNLKIYIYEETYGKYVPSYMKESEALNWIKFNESRDKALMWGK